MNFRYCDVVALVFLPKNPFLLKNFVKIPANASRLRIFTRIISLTAQVVKFDLLFLEFVL